MSVLAQAFEDAGYETPAERLERLMREAIAGNTLAEPSVAAFRRRLIADRDAAAALELVSDAVLRELYERVRAGIVKQKFAARKAADSVTPKAELPSHGETPRPGGQHPCANQPADAAGAEAVSGAYRNALLDREFNGQKLRNLTAAEARGWAKSHMRDARWLMLLTEGMPDQTLIGDAATEDSAARALDLAERIND